MRIIFLIALGLCSAQALSDKNLFTAYKSVFNFRDEFGTSNTPIIQAALIELNKMGIDSNFSSLCVLEEEKLALLLMKAAYAEYVIGLKDPNDWNIVVADAETGQLARKRSFSSTRFAIIESLLLISIIAIGRLLWIK